MANRNAEIRPLPALKALARPRGFSLIELLVVVGILGVLAAVAIPAFRGYLANARTQTAKAHLKEIADFAFICLSQNDYDGADCDTLAKIGITAPGGDWQIFQKTGSKTKPLCFEVYDRDKKVRGCVAVPLTGVPGAPKVAHAGVIAYKCEDEATPWPGNISCSGGKPTASCSVECMTGVRLGTCDGGTYKPAPGGNTCGTDVVIFEFSNSPKCDAFGACS